MPHPLYPQGMAADSNAKQNLACSCDAGSAEVLDSVHEQCLNEEHPLAVI